MEPDARITDVVHKLDNPVEYVSGVLGNFRAHPFNRKEAEVRMGITGEAKIPNYCIEQHCESMSNTLKVGAALLELSKNIELRRCFYGRNHEEILGDSFIRKNWSSASMKFDEVQTLLGKVETKN